MPEDAEATEQLVAKFPREDADWVRQYARDTDRTVAQVLRLAVRELREDVNGDD